MTDTNENLLTRMSGGRLVPIAGSWELDGLHTSTGFGVRHLLTLMRGRFKEQSGTIVIADDPTESTVSVTIQAASLDTGHPLADKTVIGDRFLDVETYPTIEFRSTAVTPAENGRWIITGDLTVKATTRSIDLDTIFLGAVTHPMGGTAKMSFQSTAAIFRADFGLVGDYAAPDGSGVLAIGNKLELTLDIEADLQLDSA